MEKKAGMDIKPKKGRKEKEKEVKENPNIILTWSWKGKRRVTEEGEENEMQKGFWLLKKLKLL